MAIFAGNWYDGEGVPFLANSFPRETWTGGGTARVARHGFATGPTLTKPAIMFQKLMKMYWTWSPPVDRESRTLHCIPDVHQHYFWVPFQDPQESRYIGMDRPFFIRWSPDAERWYIQEDWQENPEDADWAFEQVLDPRRDRWGLPHQRPDTEYLPLGAAQGVPRINEWERTWRTFAFLGPFTTRYSDAMFLNGGSTMHRTSFTGCWLKGSSGLIQPLDPEGVGLIIDAVEYITATQHFRVTYHCNPIPNGTGATGFAMAQIRPDKALTDAERHYTTYIDWTSPLADDGDVHILDSYRRWYPPVKFAPRLYLVFWDGTHLDHVAITATRI